MKKIELHWQILIGLVLAIVIGIFFKPVVPYVAWSGEIFLRALKMVVIPLIVSSIISAIINVGDAENFGRLGLKTLTYYVVTSLFAIVGGLLFMNIIEPGVALQGLNVGMESVSRPESKSISETLIGIVPSNIFESLTNGDFLPIIFFTIVVGIFSVKLTDDKHKKVILDLSSAVFELFMKITMFVVKLAPIGVFGLVVKVVAEQKDFAATGSALGIFCLAVLGATLLHACVVIPSIMYFVGKASPIKHFQNMKTMLLTAFTTASSAAALPLNMKDTSEKSGVSKTITGFTLPIGATINMDGTAIYIAGVVIFIAQVQGLALDLGDQVMILLTALLASIGTAAIPMGSLVLIGILLDLLGLPYELVGLILPVDRLLDMFRTTTNVWSDSCGAVIIAKTEGETLNV